MIFTLRYGNETREIEAHSFKAAAGMFNAVVEALNPNVTWVCGGGEFSLRMAGHFTVCRGWDDPIASIALTGDVDVFGPGV